MVLRKPYAFLIKHFKKIHIVLFAIMLYGIYKTNNLSGFFSNYARNSAGFYESTLASTYINALFFMGLILVILLSLVVFILMKQKDKPTKLYMIIAIIYIAIIVLLFVDGDYLRTIIIEQLPPRTTRMLRDVNRIAIFPQAILSFLVLIRAIGFNIKQFNFSQDIEELEIDVTDNEEFELTIGTDSGKLNRILRKNRRELKYFYLEHKLLIIGILSLSFILISSISYYNIVVVNKIYNQKDVARLNNMSYKIEDLYSTNLNYKGDNVKEGNTTFVILSLRVYNGNAYPKEINTDNMNLLIEENVYLPLVRKYDSFVDLGIGYQNQKVENEKKYIFVYKVLDEDLNKNMVLRYTDNVYFGKEGVLAQYIRFKVKPTTLDEFSTLPKANLKKEIYYGLSNLKETRLTINEVEFKDKYSYKVGSLINYINDPMDNRIIMRINYDYKPDKDISNIKTLSNLIKTYGVIKYEKDKKQVILRYKDITPLKYVDSNVYLSVPSEVQKSNSIDLIITVRNKVYIHKLK